MVGATMKVPNQKLFRTHEHYIFLNGGGMFPNLVLSFASKAHTEMSLQQETAERLLVFTLSRTGNKWDKWA